jgi:hypothetical protein
MTTTKEIQTNQNPPSSQCGRVLSARVAAVLLVAIGLLLTQRGAYADGISTTVSVDTSGLGQSGPSEVFFVLTDGDAPTPGTNTATLTDFSFGVGGSGGAVDALNTFGDVVSGANLAGGAMITDDQFTNVFAGFFTAGSQLSFSLELTTNVSAGVLAPDQFSMFIYDPDGNPIPSSDPTGFDSLLTVDINSLSPTVATYSNVVTASSGPLGVPEPGTLLLLCGGLCLVALYPHRREKSLHPLSGVYSVAKQARTRIRCPTADCL